MNPDELMDIEMPLPPAVNWLEWLWVFAELFFVLALVLGAWRLLSYFSHPLMLAWRIKKIAKQAHRLSSEQLVTQLLNWFVKAKTCDLFSSQQKIDFNNQINRLYFGQNRETKDDVSRETLLKLVSSWSNCFDKKKVLAMMLSKTITYIDGLVKRGITQFKTRFKKTHREISQ